MIFIDTSAFYAILDRDDEVHEAARAAWTDLLSASSDPGCVTSNYVLVESFALSQARLGMEAVRTLQDSILPVVQAHWITREDHKAAVHAVLSANRRGLSLVDCASFQLMRRLGIRRAFVFDRHFAEQGFSTLPG